MPAGAGPRGTFPGMRRLVAPALILTLVAACAPASPPVSAARYPIEGQLLGVQLDTDAARIDQALALGAIDAPGRDLAAEITFVCTPVLGVADEVKRALAESTGLVTDVGSAKGAIARAIDDHGEAGGAGR